VIRRLVLLALSLALGMGIINAQQVVKPLPKEVFVAKTIAIVNNTHNDLVTQGAIEALKRWGRFTIVDDSDVADIILTFDKKSTHDGSSTQTTGDDGKPSYNYGMSFSSSINMKAVMKGSESSFYTANTTESKKKAGAECVTDLQSAFISGR
jgi:hypothetical protein